MNDTNRVLNRVVLFVIGMLLLVLGAGVVVAATWPPAEEIWDAAGESAEAWLVQTAEATRIAGSAIAWLTVGALCVVIVVTALLVLALTSVRGRRTRTVLRSTGAQNPRGRVTVTESFVSDAVKKSLSSSDDVLTTSVTANTIRREPVLHISVTPRQNTSPREIVARVDRLAQNLATLTGQDTATYISVHSGLRARLAHDRRRLG